MYNRMRESEKGINDITIKHVVMKLMTLLFDSFK